MSNIRTKSLLNIEYLIYLSLEGIIFVSQPIQVFAIDNKTNRNKINVKTNMSIYQEVNKLDNDQHNEESKTQKRHIEIDGRVIGLIKIVLIPLFFIFKIKN